jgi:superfamily II DNA/RNA helicase
VHRSGRRARAQRNGLSFSVVSPKDERTNQDCRSLLGGEAMPAFPIGLVKLGGPSERVHGGADRAVRAGGGTSFNFARVIRSLLGFFWAGPKKEEEGIERVRQGDKGGSQRSARSASQHARGGGRPPPQSSIGASAARPAGRSDGRRSRMNYWLAARAAERPPTPQQGTQPKPRASPARQAKTTDLFIFSLLLAL